MLRAHESRNAVLALGAMYGLGKLNVVPSPLPEAYPVRVPLNLQAGPWAFRASA